MGRVRATSHAGRLSTDSTHKARSSLSLKVPHGHGPTGQQSGSLGLVPSSRIILLAQFMGLTGVFNSLAETSDNGSMD